MRWAATVDPAFRFSVKVPRAITQDSRLTDLKAVAEFVQDAEGLGAKLGCFLVQLPPSLTFDSATARRFFTAFRERTEVPVVCEPRHRDWFSPEAEKLLQAQEVSRVVTDPPCDRRGAKPMAAAQTLYIRLHSSPRMYYSGYDAEALEHWRSMIQEELVRGCSCWCIFDNTAAGEAQRNALELRERLKSRSR